MTDALDKQSARKSAPAGEMAANLTIRPAVMDDITNILALHCEAFSDKFGSAFGVNHITLGSDALNAAWHREGAHALNGMLVAEWQGCIIGTTTLRTVEMGNDDAGGVELAFQQVLGVWRAIRSIIALSLLSHRIERDEGFITDVAVSAPFRRCGIATTLLQNAEYMAKQCGKRYLGLYVSSKNTGAQALYRHLGFSVTRVRRSVLTWFIFGQREWLYMTRKI
jgi:ribosomal protein S18 acetylase RimI-like enzyme